MVDGKLPQSDATCLLLGGDNGHLTQHSFPALLPALTAAGLRVDFITKGPALSAAKLLGKSVVIFFADGYTQEPSEYDTVDENGQAVVVRRFGPSWMSEQQAIELEDFVLAGGSFMAIRELCIAFCPLSRPTWH